MLAAAAVTAVLLAAAEAADGGLSEAPLVGAQRQVTAEVPAAEPTAEPVKRPIVAIRATLLTGIPDMAALALTVVVPSTRVELEAGASGSLGSASAYLRGGARWWPFDSRTGDSAGVGLALSALAGPRYIFLRQGYVAANVVGALDVWLWPIRGFNRLGLNAQLVLGGMYLFGNTSREGGLAATGFVPDGRLCFGVGF